MHDIQAEVIDTKTALNELYNDLFLSYSNSADSSYAVTVLQRHLGVKADGIFGANTKAKLIEYQKGHGLAADGICGPATWGSF